MEINKKKNIYTNGPFVLMTEHRRYFVEYLLNKLILGENITHAMIFNDINTACRFQWMLHERFHLKCSVGTYIEQTLAQNNL